MVSPVRQAGFTLVEMMVALLVFAILSAAGIVLLRGAATGQEAVDERLSGMAAMQRSVSLLKADLGHAIPRPARDERGAPVAAFVTGQGAAGLGCSNPLFALTTSGQSNINNQPRSNLARVGYCLADGRLERVRIALVDGGAPDEPAALLDGVENVQLRYRDRRGVWASEWRTERMADLPRAIEMAFDVRGRTYRHKFLVGTGYL